MEGKMANQDDLLNEDDLRGKRVAILMTDGVEQVEYTGPRSFLEQNGVRVTLVAPREAGEEVQGMNHDQKGDTFKVQLSLSQARVADFDALVLPGGEENPKRLRQIPQAIAFIKEFYDADKTIAAICHGPWPLIDAGIAESRHLTSNPAIKDDLVNAGVEWTDDEVVVDGKLITSRKPEDLPAFNDALLKELMVVQQAGADPGPTS
jgi:protease I